MAPTAAMIVQKDTVTGLEFACGAPLGLGLITGEACDTAHAMIRGKSQRIALGGLETHDFFSGGLEEAFWRGGMIHPIYTGLEPSPLEFADLARTRTGLHPGVGGHAGVGGADVLAPPVVVHLVDLVDEHEAGLREIVGRGHDEVPQPAGMDGLVDAAGHEALLV